MDKGSAGRGPSDAASGLEISESPAGVRERVEGGLEGRGRPSNEDSCCREDRSSSGFLFPGRGAHCPRKDRPGGVGGPGHPCFKQFQPGTLTPEQGSGTPRVSYGGGGAPYNRPQRAPGLMRSQAWERRVCPGSMVTSGRAGGPEGDLWLIIKPSSPARPPDGPSQPC